MCLSQGMKEDAQTNNSTLLSNGCYTKNIWKVMANHSYLDLYSNLSNPVGVPRESTNLLSLLAGL